MQTYRVGQWVLCKRHAVSARPVMWPARILSVEMGSRKRGGYVLQFLCDRPTKGRGDLHVKFAHIDEYIYAGPVSTFDVPNDMLPSVKVEYMQALHMYKEEEEEEEEEDEEEEPQPPPSPPLRQVRIQHEQNQWERRRNRHFHAISEQKRQEHQPLLEIARLEQLRTQIQTNARQEYARLYPGHQPTPEALLVIEIQILLQHLNHDAELKKTVVAMFSADPENAQFPLSKHYRYIDTHRQECVGESCKICRCLDYFGNPIKVKHIKEL